MNKPAQTGLALAMHAVFEDDAKPPSSKLRRVVLRLPLDMLAEIEQLAAQLLSIRERAHVSRAGVLRALVRKGLDALAHEEDRGAALGDVSPAPRGRRAKPK